MSLFSDFLGDIVAVKQEFQDLKTQVISTATDSATQVQTTLQDTQTEIQDTVDGAKQLIEDTTKLPE